MLATALPPPHAAPELLWPLPWSVSGEMIAGVAKIYGILWAGWGLGYIQLISHDVGGTWGCERTQNCHLAGAPPPAQQPPLGRLAITSRSYCLGFSFEA